MCSRARANAACLCVFCARALMQGAEAQWPSRDHLHFNHMQAHARASPCASRRSIRLARGSRRMRANVLSADAFKCEQAYMRPRARVRKHKHECMFEDKSQPRRCRVHSSSRILTRRYAPGGSLLCVCGNIVGLLANLMTCE